MVLERFWGFAGVSTLGPLSCAILRKGHSRSEFFRRASATPVGRVFRGFEGIIHRLVSAAHRRGPLANRWMMPNLCPTLWTREEP
jgi:hypothetical protein